MITDRRKRGNLNKFVREERMLQAINHTKGGLSAITSREKHTRPEVEHGECAPGNSKRRRLDWHMKASGYLTIRSHEGQRGLRARTTAAKNAAVGGISYNLYMVGSCSGSPLRTIFFQAPIPNAHEAQPHLK